MDVALAFVDVRGSTELGESTSPAQFTEIINRFYGIVHKAVDGHDGIVDHVAGDGVMSMWIGAWVAGNHVELALAASEQMLDRCAAERIPAGVGVHSGIGYVGVVGTEGQLDFTVLGDVANTTARLGSAAAAGELLASPHAVKAAGRSSEGLERRSLSLKGKAELVDAIVLRGATMAV